MDNYAEFLQRLDAAAESLKERHDALGRARELVSAALQDNDCGYQQWTQRLERVEKLKAGNTAAAQASLQEMQTVATNMQAVFRTRCERVGARLTAVDVRIREVGGPLHELNLSKVRLTTSRRVADEREKLGQTGTAEVVDAVVSDPGLREDLRRAREAVVLAEALLELKES